MVVVDRFVSGGRRRTGVDGRVKTNVCVFVFPVQQIQRARTVHIDKYVRKSHGQRRKEMVVTVAMNDGPALLSAGRGRAGVDTAAGRDGDR